MMDVRVLIKQMATPTLPWDLVHIVGSPAAVELANSLRTELKPAP